MHVINIKFFSKEGKRYGYNIIHSTRLVAIETFNRVKRIEQSNQETLVFTSINDLNLIST